MTINLCHLRFADLVRQVRANCHLASSLQAGSFSLCGLLLRLRLLYKWEKDLPPWQEPEPDAVLAWVAQQESAWEAREGESWQELPVNGRWLNPFDVKGVNEVLAAAGLAYGAGLGRGLAPTFFLGELLEQRQLGDLTVLVVDREWARDLDGTPGLCQGPLIYARRQALAYYLWDRLADPVPQGQRYLEAALASYGVPLQALLRDPEAHQDLWEALLSGELEAIIRHELGEARETALRPIFTTILELFPQSRLELWIRGLKDALAEVNEWGRLTYLIQHRHLTSLALMQAFQPGIYPLLLPEVVTAFQKFTASGDWELLESARQTALTRLRQVATEAQELLKSPGTADPDYLRDLLSLRFLKPLGI